MRYKGVIFDLDGVICSTDAYHYAAWKVVADALDTPFEEGINDRLRGVSRMESLQIILEKYQGPVLSVAQKEQKATEKNEIYRTSLKGISPADLSPEVKSTLETLRRSGLKLAIGSSSCNAPLILDRLGLAGFFDAVVDGNQITHSKPHPEVFLKAAEKLHLPPKDCLVVEDAEAGAQAGVSGGFDVAGMGAAATGKDAKWHISGLAQLKEIVLE